ncbi:fumarylacetoacetase [Acuticoccus sp. I52.16.1]|uniref:fumarylacetoacetase n=1 Tax=Acuticoccus sp. I52.16.1 TaxID=2928472 RepID=UPI001FD13996|nr:fumarylacetoacetase [Acuticoccus sp. I52.16.1]UOM34032.1 fumarylacetoacetase [Acuticoccus sp. I52.16.1]
MRDETHDPARASWVEGAAGHPDFALQNLPYGVFSAGDAPRVGVAIGDHIADLATLEAAGLVRPDPDRTVFDAAALNPFMALGPPAWLATRRALSRLLGGEDGRLKDDPALAARALVPAARARLHMPFAVAEYTDFYASREHATNVGTMFRGADHALPANWLHIPIGYNGRASTVVVSGTDIVRPMGQLKGARDRAPRFAPCERLDFELEVGAVVGVPSAMGTRLTTAEADAAIFGYVLLNDWSARDIQVWEYVPLGPFQAKAFATSISPWVVTAAALEPFRVAPPERAVPLLGYLVEETPNNLDLSLTVDLAPAGGAARTVSRTNARGLYFSAAQQLAHHSACGCAMRVGDLLGSGTVSGPEAGSWGSLLELGWNGTTPVPLADGTTRAFLEDGDTLTLRGWCEREGAVRIGFGAVGGTVLPARP